MAPGNGETEQEGKIAANGANDDGDEDGDGDGDGDDDGDTVVCEKHKNTKSATILNITVLHPQKPFIPDLTFLLLAKSRSQITQK